MGQITPCRRVEKLCSVKDWYGLLLHETHKIIVDNPSTTVKLPLLPRPPSIYSWMRWGEESMDTIRHLNEFSDIVVACTKHSQLCDRVGDKNIRTVCIIIMACWHLSIIVPCVPQTISCVPVISDHGSVVRSRGVVTMRTQSLSSLIPPQLRLEQTSTNVHICNSCSDVNQDLCYLQPQQRVLLFSLGWCSHTNK